MIQKTFESNMMQAAAAMAMAVDVAMAMALEVEVTMVVNMIKRKSLDN